ncbi:hypothetical protein Prudu_009567 [Prunus dulcis]|uniref:THH1/TOM1/TOM3 domain-containing protein n=1 Tax=Prunus dulcis TaxID=3755 RepID=A0A4Y1R6H4_PRUDU|nr:hypothetical protein Prudu_009567 [Prunus dulcis]
MMFLELLVEKSDCFPLDLLVFNIALAFFNGVLAVIAFSQLVRIHMRNRQSGWTRQKVLHLMIGSSNLGWLSVNDWFKSLISARQPECKVGVLREWVYKGSNCIRSVLPCIYIDKKETRYFIYFTSTLVAACKKWFCWSNVCGLPQNSVSRSFSSTPILLIRLSHVEILEMLYFMINVYLAFARFPSEISRVDLCHQANDDEEDDEDDSMQQALLENSKNKPNSSNKDGHRICCSFQSIHVGSHQKFVIAVVVLVLVLMMSFAVVIWIGVGKNPIDSSAVAQLRKVRSEKASSEMWKVAGLAITSVICFTSSALVALLTNIPVSGITSKSHIRKTYEVKTSFGPGEETLEMQTHVCI